MRCFSNSCYFLSAFYVVDVVTAQLGPNLYGVSKASIYGCIYPLSQLATFCDSNIDYWSCWCNNLNARASVSGCLNVVGEFTLSTKEAFNEICMEFVGTTVTSKQWENSLEYYMKSAITIDHHMTTGFKSSEIVNSPVKLDDEYIQLWHESYINWLVNNYDNALFLSSILVWWILAVAMLATILKWSKVWFSRILSSSTENAIQKYLLLPALWGRNKCEEKEYGTMKLFSMLVPTRGESITITILGLLNAFLYTYNLHFIDNDPLFKTRTFAFFRYIAARSGIAGTMLTPLVILFAGRNNTLMKLTGWNYATLITYHKWISRIAFLNIYIHSIAYVHTFKIQGRYEEFFAKWYLIWGVAGTFAMTLIILQSILYLRRRWYEAFVCLHIVLVLVYIIGSWIHLKPLGYLFLVLPSVAFWVFDRTIRFTKLIRFGFPLATIKVVGEKEDITLKVTIPKPKNWNHFTGSFIWIQFLVPRSWWQSHPFTCIVERQDRDGDREEVIVLYCKVKEGVTEDLYKRLSTTPAKEGKIRVAVEGPYVDACQNFYNHNVTFIAGGSGIPGLYSEAKSLAQTKQRGLSRIIRLFWIVKNYESVGWFKNELASLEDLGVQVTIFVTRHKKVPCGTKETNAIDRLKVTLPSVLFIERRPDLEEIINEDVKSPSVGFVACGHPRMVDEVRALVVQSLDLHPGQRLDFYELLQVWS